MKLFDEFKKYSNLNPFGRSQKETQWHFLSEVY